MKSVPMTLQQVKITSVIVILSFVFVGTFGFTEKYDSIHGFSSGPPPGVTGAPGEADCTSCHSDFATNSGTGSVVITDVPTNYELDTPYDITVTVTENNSISIGFQLTALVASGAAAGDFSLPVQSPAEMQIANTQINGDERIYVEHTNFGIGAAGTRSWTFTWNSPSTDVGPVTFYAAGNGSNADKSTGGDFIYTTNVVSNFSTSNPSPTKFDFDGDQKADVSIFRPGPGEWWYLRSSDGGNNAFQFGAGSDVTVPADFTGDGQADFAFWRPSTFEWFVLRSEDSSFFSFPFGTTGDIPAPGDFDGDGTADPAVFRPSTATWFILRSSDSQVDFVSFGTSGDIPLVDDYDNDGKDDIAIYRPSAAQFWILRSEQGLIANQFGEVGDYAMSGDFSGDGTADVALFRPASGFWFVLRSEDGGFFGFPFGTNGDIPAPGDYDGDGIIDPTVYRPSQTTWFTLQSTNDMVSFTGFGIAADRPVPSSYVYIPE